MTPRPRIRSVFPLGLILAAVASAAPESGPVIDVVARRLESSSYTSPYGELSVSEQTASIPGVRLVRQGAGGPQADLRIRGGAFSSSGYAIEGLALFNPQTEHFHADLPIAPLLSDSIRLMTGIEQFRLYSGHASGSVAVDLAAPEDHLKINLADGSFGFFSSSLSAGWSRPGGAGGSRGGTFYVEHDRAGRTDGYADNDLTRWTGGLLLRQTEADPASRATLLAALSSRRFGARGFYGAPASYPSEEENATFLLLGSASRATAGEPVRLTAGWQHTEDRYWLSRDNRGLFENHTRSEELAAHADAAPRVSPALSLRLRGDVNAEIIRGHYKGTIPGSGLGDHSRARLAAGLLPEWTRGSVTLSAGGGGEWFDTDKPAWLPAAGVTWKPAPGQTVFASVSGAVRQPSYTELNYESPGSLGNRNLKRQESLRSEAGWQAEDAQGRIGGTVFWDDSRRVVDWVQAEPGARWTAVNLDRVRTAGFLGYASRRLGDRWSLNGEYLALDKDSNEPVYASRYALDYARQEWRAGIRVAPASNWRIGIWQTAGFYRRNPARRHGAAEYQSNLEAQYRFNRFGAVVSAGIANLWDRDFESLPGQPPAGRQIYVSTSFVL